MTLNRRGGVSFVSQGDKSVVGKVLNDDFYRGAYWRQIFPGGIVHGVDTDGFSDPTGATGDLNFLQFPGGMTAAYHIKGAGQTILAPFNNASGGFLDAGLDQTAAEGVEYLLGGMQTINNPFAIQQDGAEPAAFVRLEFDHNTVANVAEAAVGFRRAEASQANLDDYADLVCVNIQAGTVNVETILNAAATDTEDTGLTLADDTHVIVEVRMTKAGVPSFFVNGAKVGPAYQMDAGDVFVPFIFFLQGGGTSAFRWYDAACGRLWHERNDPLVQSVFT